MKLAHWDDPQLRRIGKTFADRAYDLADSLDWYGADGRVYLLPVEQRAKRWEKIETISIPTAFADALMAMLLSLPRKGGKRGRRPVWSIAEAQKRVNSGEPKRKIAREFSEETGLNAESIRRQLRGKEAGKKSPKKPRG
jgi:hypothetical protein